MGCFLTCLRYRNDDRLRSVPSDSTPESFESSSRDKFASGNRLASLFLWEEEDSLYESDLEHDDEELKKEVKLLKACGAISKTPMEMQKLSKKTEIHVDENESSFKSQTTISFASGKKHEQEEQTNSIPIFPSMEDSACNSVSFASVLVEASKDHPVDSNLEDSPVDTNRQRVVDQVPESDQRPNLEDSPVDTNCQRVVDQVPESDLSSNSSNISNSHVASEGKFTASNKSPFPTPLKLSDEMQTPGTIYPQKKKTSLIERNVQVRNQYIHPVPNSSQDISWSKISRDNATGFPDRERGAHVLNIMPLGTTFDSKWVPAQDASVVIESLLQWMEPPVPENDRRKKWEGPKKEVPEFDMDRPIIGTVATHWNEDGLSHTCPKWWDGNGIPNSNRKYKEDQKISWHATPFEERLNMALSEENVYPESKSKINPIKFEDGDAKSDPAPS